MATKILTGVLVPKLGYHRNGSAVILFNPFMVAGDANGVDLNQTGEGAFAEPPTKKVSIRQARVGDKEVGPAGKELGILNINDGPPNVKYMTVDWNTSGRSELRAMSFLLVGDVED
jgi:hypothetical protein